MPGTLPGTRSLPCAPLPLLVLQRLHTRRQRPLAAADRFVLLVGPHAVLVEIPARVLLGLALLVAADPEPEEEVDQQHGQAAADGHRERVYPEAAWIDDQQHDAGQDHHAADAVAEDQHPDRTVGSLLLIRRLS